MLANSSDKQQKTVINNCNCFYDKDETFLASIGQGVL